MNETTRDVNNQAQQSSISLIRQFYTAKESHDLDAAMASFADDAVYIFPLSASGTPEPWFKYEGKPAIRNYQSGVLARFSQIRMVDPHYTASVDGQTVFVETHGDYIAREGNQPYRNIYVFKFVLRDDKIAEVYEYANPVTFAKLAGLPIG